MTSIEELEFLSENLLTMDLFTQVYERTLNTCKETGDKNTAEQIQKILFKQAAYLMNEWIREKAATQQNEIIQ